MGAEDLDVAEERLEMLRRQVRLCSWVVDPIFAAESQKSSGLHVALRICSTWSHPASLLYPLGYGIHGRL
jgi:hypothetical protein